MNVTNQVFRIVPIVIARYCGRYIAIIWLFVSEGVRTCGRGCQRVIGRARHSVAATAGERNRLENVNDAVLRCHLEDERSESWHGKCAFDWRRRLWVWAAVGDHPKDTRSIARTLP